MSASSSSAAPAFQELLTAVNQRIRDVGQQIHNTEAELAEAAGNQRNVDRLSKKEEQLRDEKKVLNERLTVLMAQQYSHQQASVDLAATVERLRISEAAAERKAQQAEVEKAAAEQKAQQAEQKAQQADVEKAAAEQKAQQADVEKAAAEQKAQQAEQRNYASVIAMAQRELMVLGNATFDVDRVTSKLESLSVGLSGSLDTVDATLIENARNAAQSGTNVESVASSLTSAGGDGDNEPQEVSLPSYHTNEAVGVIFPAKPVRDVTTWTNFSKLGNISEDSNLELQGLIDDDMTPPQWFQSLMTVLQSLILLLWISVNVHDDVPVPSLKQVVSSSTSSSSSSSSRAARLKPPPESSVQLAIARVLQVCGQHFDFDVCDATGGPSLYLQEWAAAGFSNCKGKTDLLIWFRDKGRLAVMIEVKVALSQGKFLSQFYASLAAFTCGRNACWNVADMFREADEATALPLGLLFNGIMMMRAHLQNSSTVCSDDEFVPALRLWNVFRRLATAAPSSEDEAGPMSPGKPTRSGGAGGSKGASRGGDGGRATDHSHSGGSLKDKKSHNDSSGKGSGRQAMQPVSLSALNVLMHNMDMHGEKMRDMGFDID
jgi:hypothetical protein